MIKMNDADYIKIEGNNEVIVGKLNNEGEVLEKGPIDITVNDALKFIKGNDWIEKENNKKETYWINPDWLADILADDV